MDELTIIPYVLGYLTRVYDTKKQVLLVYRSTTGFGNNQYSLAGGKINKAESPDQALIRELGEELSIKIKPEDVNFRTLLYFEGATRTCVAFLFSIAQWEGEPLNNEPAKHDHIAWFDLSHLPSSLLPRHKILIRQLEEGIIYGCEGFTEIKST
ncbi:NUDIX domain-containing protein [Candidatus Dependentiae bacterium]|nr:NUDIX domain-containing protein [Candidatus Dependentiae bacterium]